LVPVAFQGILDIFKEGFARLFSGGGPRALPMWYLIPTTVAFGLAHYVVSASVGTAHTYVYICTYAYICM
jgi:hypothetical protein